MTKTKIIAAGILILLTYSCASLVLQPADFSWPVESVLKINDEGLAKEDRYTFSFNIKPLFYEEMQDSLAYLDREVRIIRNTEGFYFITAAGFKNVYVFETSDGALEMENKILVNENGLTKPVFNQRNPLIELIDGQDKYYLTKKGIEEDKK